MNRIKLGGISFSLLLVFQSVVTIAQNPQFREAQVACAIMREIPRSDAYKKLEYVEQVRLKASQAPYIGDVATINEAIRLGLCEELVLNRQGWIEAIEDAQEAERLAETEAWRQKYEQQMARFEKEEAERERQREAQEKGIISESKLELSIEDIATKIQSKIVQNWRRPPLARDGMEVLLDLRLTRDGVLESISVVESSGDATFDRSAISAVERVGKFEKIDELSTEDFERYFQYFRLRFKPEDLRY